MGIFVPPNWHGLSNHLSMNMKSLLVIAALLWIFLTFCTSPSVRAFLGL